MEPSAEQIQLWFHYEEIAMHFNELLIRYRLQLMGGAGAIGAIASYLIGIKSPEIENPQRVRAAVSWILFVLLLAAACLDLFYYNILLLGAVEALTTYEKTIPGIEMSTIIESQFKNKGTNVIWLVYSIILLPLFLFSCWCTFYGKSKKNG